MLRKKNKHSSQHRKKKKAHSKHRIINSVREKKHPHTEKECQYIVVDYLQPCVYNTIWKSQSFMYCVYDLMNGCTSKAYWQHAGSMWASHFLSSVRVELKRTVTAAFHWRSAQHVSIKGNSTKTEQISIIYEAQRMKEKKASWVILELHSLWWMKADVTCENVTRHIHWSFNNYESKIKTQ